MYLDAADEIVSLEDAETPKVTIILQFLVRYHLNEHVSTMSFHVHRACVPWSDDCISPSIYYNSTDHYLIGGTIFISSLINVAFDPPCEH
jgi:hypothetical protein